MSDGTDKYPMARGGLFTPTILQHCDLRTFDEVSIFISKHIKKHPVLVETGTMYTWDPEIPCWNTTTSLAKRICVPLEGSLVSIDVVHDHDMLHDAFKAALS